MKKLILTLAIAVSALIGTAQDGLARWIDTDSIDVFISVYNSPIDTRIGVADLFLEEAKQNGLQATTFKIIVNDAIVIGETFITISKTYILFDIYVDEVKYPNGKVYAATRHIKPIGPIDYNKY
jgi:hypothetical protein